MSHRKNQIMNWNDFKDRFGTGKTTNFDLLDIGKRLHLKINYVMRDELRKLSKNTKDIIMNLDSSDGRGTHHTALYNTPDYKLYFSSFGDNPPREVIAFFDKTTTTTTIREYNDFQIQEFGAEYCGQMSMYVLYRLNFTNDTANDIILSLYEYSDV
jgi:hypothetical protein